MRRGTTPTIKINISGVDTSTISKWYIIIQQGEYELVKENDDITIEDNVINVPLSQEETLGFRSGDLDVQIRAVTKDGQRIASDIKRDSVDGLLWDEVI